jgi:hypothetical protein
MKEKVTNAGRLRARKAYSGPLLRQFGPVGALTQSGTGIDPEGTNPNGMCTTGPSRAMC